MGDAIHDLTAAYALDALEGDERDRYEIHLASCVPCREELEGFWRVSGSLAHAAAGPAPPAALRSRILTEAARDRGNVISLWQRFALPTAASLAAAAAVAAIGLGLWSTSLSGQVDDLRGELAGNSQVVAILSDPSARHLPLDGADGRVVLVETGRAALVLSNLDRAPTGKTYEIWVMDDGNALRAGLFDGADARTVVVLTRPVPDDAIVAVTLENDGGVDVPTGSPLFSSPAV